MKETPVILVTGPPASGKTTLAGRLGELLQLPVFGKDDLKEILFEILGSEDRARSRRLGIASLALLFRIAEIEIENGRSLILEANFSREHDSERAKRLATIAPVTIVQVVCRCSTEVLKERYRSRSASGERHPGHHDEPDSYAFDTNVESLNLRGPVLDFETTSYSDEDVQELAGLLFQGR